MKQRLIDADALKNLTEKVACCGLIDLDVLKIMIDDAPTIDAAPKWIPYEERLPREKEVVLITNSEGNVRCGQFRGTSGKRWFWIGNTLEMVEAWMPLPKPYKGERKDDEFNICATR